MAKLNLVLSQRYASLLQVRGRIGQRLELKADYSQKSIGRQRVGFSWKVQRHDVAFNEEGEKRIDLNMIHNKFNFYLTNEWHKVKYIFGVNYNIFNYGDVLADEAFSPYVYDKNRKYNEHFFTYYIDGEFNSLDRQYYPTSGHLLKMNVDVISDNLYQYDDMPLFPIFGVSWQGAISPTSRLTLIPHVESRIMWIRDDIDEPLALMNVVGGLFKDMHFIQQRTMAGVSEMELLMDKAYAIGGLTMQYNTFRNQFLQLTGDMMTHTSKIEDAFKQEALTWGVEASYGIRTQVGPLSLKCYWSDLTGKFRVSINAGYYF